MARARQMLPQHIGHAAAAAEPFTGSACHSRRMQEEVTTGDAVPGSAQDYVQVEKY